MSKKQSQNAPAATDTKPTEQMSSEKEISPNSPMEQSALASEQTSSPEPFQLIPPFKISGKAKGMAKAAGINLESIEEMAPRMNEWASSVEQRLNVILAAIPNIPAETVRYLQQEAAKQRAEMQQRAQQQPQQAQAGDMMGQIGTLAQMGKELGIFGNTSNPFQEKMERFMGAIMDKGLNDIISPKASIAERVGEEVLLKFASRRAAEAAEAVNKT